MYYCLQKIHPLSPLVVSVDDILGVEAEDALKRIASCLAMKWNQPYL